MALMRLLLAALLFLPKLPNAEETLTDRYYENFILPQNEDASECYQLDGNIMVPQRCVAPFENAAFNKDVSVSNTCGTRQPTHFCTQISLYGSSKTCGVCDDRVRDYAHPAKYLTDFNDPKKETWWQSETMNEGIQSPNNVTITLNLGKSYDVTYVRLKFSSPRPESFAIYKKTTHDGEWIPWQYYSGSCKSTYKMPDRAPILPGNEAVAQCTREFSDISPLTGGNIAFSTLDGRPSAEIFEESEVLQDWVTAVAIRVVLNRLNTFGDEVFKDPKVLKSYYYAISDFAVGGRCKCNGHAKSCVTSSGIDVDRKFVCECQHNTAGEDCEKCDSFHQDRPWRRGTSEEANECLPCNCNGLSSRCYFDSALYNQTGHGGHCLDCSGNTKGANCEICLDGFYRRKGEHFCVECDCDAKGSFSTQCNDRGQCPCKPGVTGQRCDQCKAGYYDFSPAGCKDCHCEAAGSWNNQPQCSPYTGDCQCKSNVEGQKCDKCKPGYFGLSTDNTFGCTPCFCYGHSSICSHAEGYFSHDITSEFFEGDEGWTARSERKLEEIEWSAADRAIAVAQNDYYSVFFEAPAEYLGDLRFAYNQELSFNLRVEIENHRPSNRDVLIVGANGLELVSPIKGQNNQIPATFEQIYRFRLHQSYWHPRLPEIDFIGILANVTAIKIRGTYSPGDVGYLSRFSLSTASPTVSSSSVPALWVERCECPPGHIGQFCESCAPGYRRAVKFGGPLTKCIKCDCHGHSDSCDAESGACICQHNTAGDTCETCARGYYGNALNGTETDCRKCDCPEDGPCLPLPEGGMACTECAIGHAGAKCEFCASEYFGNPQEGRPCQPCPCNDNIDFNAIGNCDTHSGQCLKCIYNTTGFNCERCKPGFWGNATSELRNDCKECNCYPPGTRNRLGDFDSLICHPDSGQCDCKPHVEGQNCDTCEKGYYNITSGNGCTKCECDILGSEDNFCDVVTGQCSCKAGVTGLKCEKCSPQFYGFGSAGGCQACDCDHVGSETQECDAASGQCLCRDNVEGRRCDQCSENRFNMRAGCLPCDDCYTLIQSRKNQLVQKMEKIEDGLGYWETNPVNITDEKITQLIAQEKATAQKLRNQVQEALDPQTISRIKSFQQQLPRASKALSKTSKFAQLFVPIDDTLDELQTQLDDFNTMKKHYEYEMHLTMYKIKTDGGEVLKKASEAVKTLGSHDENLSMMAKTAYDISQKHNRFKNQLKEQTKEVITKHHKSRHETEEAIYGEKASAKVQKLWEMTNGTRVLLDKTKAVAAASLADTKQIYDETTKMLAKADSIQLPITLADIEQLKKQIERSRNESAYNYELAKESLQSQIELRKSVQTSLKDAQDQLRAMESQNRNEQSILKDLMIQKNKTEHVKQELEKSVAEAKRIVDALDRYNNEDEVEGKDQFIEMLGQIGAIQRDIDSANNKTLEVEKVYGNSQNLFQMMYQALAIAQEAEGQAEYVAKQAAQLNEAVDTLTQSVDKTENELTKIGDVLATLQEASAELERVTEKRKEAEARQREMAMTELKAKIIQGEVSELQEIVQDMLVKMGTFEAVSEDTLAELETLLKDTQDAMKKSRVKRRLRKQKQKLEEARIQLQTTLVMTERAYDDLRETYEAIPDTCYNQVRLEQTGETP